MAKKKRLLGSIGNSEYFLNDLNKIVDEKGADAPPAIAKIFASQISNAPIVQNTSKVSLPSVSAFESTTRSEFKDRAMTMSKDDIFKSFAMAPRPYGRSNSSSDNVELRPIMSKISDSIGITNQLLNRSLAYSMSTNEFLKDISKTLNNMFSSGAGIGGGGVGNVLGDLLGSVGGGGGKAGKAGSAVAKSGAASAIGKIGKAAALKSIISKAGSMLLGVGEVAIATNVLDSFFTEKPYDKKADDSNWDKLSSFEKLGSGFSRGLESVESIFGSNIQSQFTDNRVKDESERTKDRKGHYKTTNRGQKVWVDDNEDTAAIQKLKEKNEKTNDKGWFSSIFGTQNARNSGKPALVQSAPMSNNVVDLRGKPPTVNEDRDDRAKKSDIMSGTNNKLLDMIAKGESGKAGYDAVLGNGKYGMPTKKVSEMTLNEVLAYGDTLRQKALSTDGTNSSALGRYQIVGKTLRGLMKQLGLTGDEKFDEKMQDRMAMKLANQRGNNPNELRKEWTSLNRLGSDEISNAYSAGTSGNSIKSLTQRKDYTNNLLNGKSTIKEASSKEDRDSGGSLKLPGLDGVNSTLAGNLQKAAALYKQLTGKTITVTSGVRSTEKQAQLWAAHQRGESPYPVAPPGTSKHERGMAVDINRADADAMDKQGILSKFGLSRPVAHDPVHIELSGGGNSESAPPIERGKKPQTTENRTAKPISKESAIGMPNFGNDLMNSILPKNGMGKMLSTAMNMINKETMHGKSEKAGDTKIHHSQHNNYNTEQKNNSTNEPGEAGAPMELLSLIFGLNLKDIYH